MPAARQHDSDRHGFVVIIPVADRPRQLAKLLKSLFAQCVSFGYGGIRNGRYRKIIALVADDSANEGAIQHNRAIAREFDAAGLTTVYFGAEEQATQWQALSEAQRQSMVRIVGDPVAHGFRHKGASVTRNLALLHARRMSATDGPWLFHFVDSDEQFAVLVARPDGDGEVVAIDYFDRLDRIFSAGAVQVLTGKVVGDPPVSPAVMAGNFLADVNAFLQRIATTDPALSCTFHGLPARGADDAAYHDMADLFGFTGGDDAYAYHCTLTGPHDHARCLAGFAGRLDRFFHGEHPTRIAYHHEAADPLAIVPARTVYTGNYVCTAAALAHFIPFAPLKLRMAGPTLGRLLRSEIGAGFVSANLPLLHARTLDGEDGLEFRPGIRREAGEVDLSGEFERQFFGDVMLFAIERLIERGYPDSPVAADEIGRVFDAVAAALHEKYETKRVAIMARLDQARALFDAPDAWWRHAPGLAQTRSDFARFIGNIQRNFAADSNCQRLIRSAEHLALRLREMAEALAAYRDDRKAWLAVLATLEAAA